MKSLSISHNITIFQWSLRIRSKSVVVDPRFHWNWFSWHFYYCVWCFFFFLFVCLVFVGWIIFFLFFVVFMRFPRTSISVQPRLLLFGCLFIFCLVRMVFYASIYTWIFCFFLFFFRSNRWNEHSNISTNHLFLLCVELPLSAKSLIVMRLFLLLSFAVEIFFFDAT